MKFEEFIHNLKTSVSLTGERKRDIKTNLFRIIEANSMVRTAPRIRLVKYFLQRMPVAALALLVAILGGGTAFAAQSSLPGDILYPVKINVNEKVASAFFKTPQARAEWQGYLVSERLDEATELAAKGTLTPALAQEVKTNLNVHIENVQKAITAFEAGGNTVAAADAAVRLESALEARGSILAAVGSHGQESEGIAPLVAEVATQLGEVKRANVSLEAQISTEDGENGMKTVAEERLREATDAIKSTKNFIEGHKKDFGTSFVDNASGTLGEASEGVVRAGQNLTQGSYGDAFNSANNALRAAEEAQLNAVARDRFHVDIGTEDMTSETTSTATSIPTSTTPHAEGPLFPMFMGEHGDRALSTSTIPVMGERKLQEPPGQIEGVNVDIGGDLEGGVREKGK